MNKSRAFTLIELLIVVAVVGLLAAILFPVFAQAKRAAVQTSCLGRFHQVGQATTIYLNDYDDVFMPVNYQPGQPPNAKTDRTWVQMLLPYTENFRTFRCPADVLAVDESVGVFDEDLIPGDLFGRYYTASMHVNTGYNFQYLSPIFKQGDNWAAQPKNENELPDPAEMLLYIDSAWQISSGQPIDGGTWLVSPPCRYEEVAGSVIDTISMTRVAGVAPASMNLVYTPVTGWEPANNSGPTYGGAWPWHSGKMTIATVEGSVRSITVNQLGSGCDIQPDWQGSIQDRREYLWSPQ